MTFRKKVFRFCIAVNVVFFVGLTAISMRYHLYDKNRVWFQQLTAKTAMMSRYLWMNALQQRRLVITTEKKNLDPKYKKLLYDSMMIAYVGELQSDGKLKDLYTSEIMKHQTPLIFPQKKGDRYFSLFNQQHMMTYWFDKSTEIPGDLESDKIYIVTSVFEMKSLKAFAGVTQADITFVEEQNYEYQIIFSTLNPEEQDALRDVFIEGIESGRGFDMKNEKHIMTSQQIFETPQIKQAMIFSYLKVEYTFSDYFIVLMGSLLMFCLSSLTLLLGYWWAEKSLKH
ncbi:MAG: hypothetical protein K2Q26_06540 [Bdellovibrionales bacterium]|nr:hypothetical protein [Bdellovibrionales bacterium]